MCGCGAIDQAARDRLSRASSNSRASISLRIADNRGSTACGSSASSFALSASIAAFSVSIILVITASIRGGGGFHGIEIAGHAGEKRHRRNRPLRPRPHSRTLPPNNFAINPPPIGPRRHGRKAFANGRIVKVTVDASVIVADAHRRRGVAKIKDLDPTSSRAVAEYLSVLDDAAFGGATPVEPKSISPTDPAARYTAAANTPAVYAYSDNYLIDLKNAVIMDVEATTAIRQAEVGAAKTMLDRTAEQFDVAPSRLVADAGYGSAEMIGWLMDERGIRAARETDGQVRAHGRRPFAQRLCF